VSYSEIQRDGGTVTLIFSDARGCEYRVCRDAHMSVGPDTKPLRSSRARFIVGRDELGCSYPLCLDSTRPHTTDTKPRCLYVGSLSPGDSAAVYLDPDSELAAGVLEALERWAAEQLTPDELVRTQQAKWASGLSEDEYDVWKVLLITRSIRNRLCAVRAAPK
jgi:hypothetical protein